MQVFLLGGWGLNNLDYQIWYYVQLLQRGIYVASWEVPFDVILYVLHFVVQVEDLSVFFLLLITVREC